MIRKVAWFIFFCILTVSCLDNPDCYNLSIDTIGISFKKMADGKADTVMLLGVSMDGTDSLFYETTALTDLLLPLNYLQNQSTITFTRPGITDPVVNTLVLDYTSQAQFVSEDCQERYIISNLKITSSNFDSTRVVSKTPTRNPSTNLIIYRCPITNLVRLSFRQWDTNPDDTLGSALSANITGISDDFSPYIYYAGQAASTVRLPVNASANSTTFNIGFADFGTTSINLNYSVTDNVLFAQCGEQNLLSNLSVPNIVTEFDKVEIVNDSIEDPPRTNISFFKCPETNRVKIVFRESAGSSTDVTVNLVRITADYTAEEFYVGSSVPFVELPLNNDNDVTTFTFVFEEGEKTVTLKYNRNQNVYHEVCNQTEMAGLEIQSATGFATTPEVLNNEVQFPTVSNIAVFTN